jgi:hypothetical protein
MRQEPRRRLEPARSSFTEARRDPGVLQGSARIVSSFRGPDAPTPQIYEVVTAGTAQTPCGPAPTRTVRTRVRRFTS